MRSFLLVALFAAGCSSPTPAPRIDLSALERTWVDEPSPRALTDLELVDHHGHAFDEGDLVGHWSLVFVGYTSCPDVCPTTLGVLGPALERLQDVGVQGVFVGVDPERDREALADLVNFHHPALTGVTGEREAIDHLVGALGAAYQITSGPGEPVRVDHSTSIFLVDPTVRVVGYVLRPSSAGQVEEDVRGVIEGWRPPVLFEEAWIRPASSKARVRAGFGAWTNPSTAPVTIVGAQASQVASVEVHRTVEEAGMARMAPAGPVVVPPGERVMLEPGGLHLMLVEPTQPLEPGSSVVVRLALKEEAPVQFRVPVRPRP